MKKRNFEDDLREIKSPPKREKNLEDRLRELKSTSSDDNSRSENIAPRVSETASNNLQQNPVQQPINNFPDSSIPYPTSRIWGRPTTGMFFENKEFLKSGKVGEAYWKEDYEETIRLARKIKPPTMSSVSYLQSALNKTAYNAIDDANRSSFITRGYYIRKARKRFNESAGLDHLWKTNKSSIGAKMGIVLTYLMEKKYEKAEEELDKLNEPFKNQRKEIALPTFTVLCYFDMIKKGYPISDEKWRYAAGEFEAVANYTKGIEKEIYDLLMENTQKRESIYRVANLIQKEKIDADSLSFLGSLYTPILYALDRIAE